jgi:2-polyprenyl-3-methyl-5-hydroxy-6-metoxy-1,4-benzoquinol methylase
MKTLDVRCNICDSDDYTILFPEGKAQIRRIVKCKNCALMYANPQDRSSLAREISLSSGGQIDIRQIRQGLDDFNVENSQYLRKQYIQQKDYTTILDFLDNRDKGSLLEIGSYAGVFLNTAKQYGWDVLGIEPQSVARLYSEGKYGLKIQPTTFEDSDIQESTIDVIVALHVIEHVFDPKLFVQKANILLKKSGILVLETPTYDSLSFKILKHRERSVRMDGHIYFFTEKTLRSLIEKCGFHVLKHETVGRTLGLDRLATNLGIVTNQEKMFERISRMLNLQKYIIHVNLHDMQRIYCEKI